VHYRLAGRIKDIKTVKRAARVNNKKPLRVDRSPIGASPRQNIQPCKSEIPCQSTEPTGIAPVFSSQRQGHCATDGCALSRLFILHLDAGNYVPTMSIKTSERWIHGMQWEKSLLFFVPTALCLPSFSFSISWVLFQKFTHILTCVCKKYWFYT